MKVSQFSVSSFFMYLAPQAGHAGEGQIVTQPGYFCITGDGTSVGRDSASAVSPEYDAPFPFTGGTIEKVVVDVSGEHYVDHEAQVIGWFMKD
jgi:arylsulfatase